MLGVHRTRELPRRFDRLGAKSQRHLLHILECARSSPPSRRKTRRPFAPVRNLGVRTSSRVRRRIVAAECENPNPLEDRFYSAPCVIEILPFRGITRHRTDVRKRAHRSLRTRSHEASPSRARTSSMSGLLIFVLPTLCHVHVTMPNRTASTPPAQRGLGGALFLIFDILYVAHETNCLCPTALALTANGSCREPIANGSWKGFGPYPVEIVDRLWLRLREKEPEGSTYNPYPRSGPADPGYAVSLEHGPPTQPLKGEIYTLKTARPYRQLSSRGRTCCGSKLRARFPLRGQIGALQPSRRRPTGRATPQRRTAARSRSQRRSLPHVGSCAAMPRRRANRNLRACPSHRETAPLRRAYTRATVPAACPCWRCPDGSTATGCRTPLRW